MTRARVLQIIGGFAVEGPLGGIERVVIELSQNLGIDQVEPIVCGLWLFGTPYELGWIDLLLAAGVESFAAAQWDPSHPFMSFWHALKGIQRRLDGQRVDIIHSHTQFGDIIAILLKRKLGARKIVRTVHNSREWSNRPVRRVALTEILFPLMFDREVGVSQTITTNLNCRFLARKLSRKAQCIYNGVDASQYSRNCGCRVSKRRELGISEDAFVVGSIGRLTRQKGFHVFIQAAANVAARVPLAHFILVGDGELLADLRARVHDLGLDAKFVFTGGRNDINEMFSLFDIFVSSSLWEGLPTVLLECALAKVPVIATNVSGSTEIVRHLSTGIIVEPGNVDQLAQAIIEVYHNPAVASTYANSAHIDVLQKFSITAARAKYRKLYLDLLSV
jgi:glycosyltransferase involved in cell wall biosynthesis